MVSNDLHSAKFKGIFSALISLDLSDVWGTAFIPAPLQASGFRFLRHCYCLFFSFSTTLLSSPTSHTYMSLFSLTPFRSLYFQRCIYKLLYCCVPLLFYSTRIPLFSLSCVSEYGCFSTNMDPLFFTQFYIHQGHVQTQRCSSDIASMPCTGISFPPGWGLTIPLKVTSLEKPYLIILAQILYPLYRLDFSFLFKHYC